MYDINNVIYPTLRIKILHLGEAIHSANIQAKAQSTILQHFRSLYFFTSLQFQCCNIIMQRVQSEGLSTDSLMLTYL